jgi:recombinational DNA repair protein RecT
MSGAPDWSDIPPPEDTGRGPSGGRSKRSGPPPMTEEQLKAASADFFEWLAAPETHVQLKMLLPDHVDADVFIATAKSAVLTKPQLLREDFRPSLMIGLMKAAAQGLLPDGKQGVLVPRYDSDSRTTVIAWQPMIWGVVKLGRETGAIREIRAMLVFYGEPFRIIQGDQNIIEHEVDLDIVDAAYAALNAGRDANGNPLSRPLDFIAHVRAAYCLITGMDGTITKRWMTRQRLISLWESTRAEKGPWSGRWVDEMFLKGMILFTAKWINLDPNSIAAKRFQAAMLTDLNIDFDRDDNIVPLAAEPAALPAPGDRLTAFEDGLMNLKPTKAPVETQPHSARHPGTAKAKPTDVPAREVKPETKPAAAKPARTAKAAPAEDKPIPFIERAATALLIDGGVGFKWMRTLEFALRDCPSMDDLAALKAVPSVVRNSKAAPAAVKTEIALLFRNAAERLSNFHNQDGWPMDETGQAA